MPVIFTNLLDFFYSAEINGLIYCDYFNRLEKFCCAQKKLFQYISSDVTAPFRCELNILHLFYAN